MSEGNGFERKVQTETASEGALLASETTAVSKNSSERNNLGSILHTVVPAK